MKTESVLEGLWALSEEAEQRQKNIPLAIKCLECAVQPGLSLLPLAEVRTRLRLADLLLTHTHNLTHAKSHLERAHLLLSRTPSALPLKLRAHSLLSHAYHLTGSIPPQKHILLKALHLLRDDQPHALPMWTANFNAQLASALAIEGDYAGALAALAAGMDAADAADLPDLRMFFSASALHVHLMHWKDSAAVEAAAGRCEEIWNSMGPDKRKQCVGLFFYHELLQTFYLLRICDYKSATQHVDKLDAAMKADVQKVTLVKELKAKLDSVNQTLSKPNLQRKERSTLAEKKDQLEEQLRAATGLDRWDESVHLEQGKLLLAPPPLDGEWLPKNAVYALVDLMTVMLGRPKGVFKESGRRIQSGLNLIHGEPRRLLEIVV